MLFRFATELRFFHPILSVWNNNHKVANVIDSYDSKFISAFPPQTVFTADGWITSVQALTSLKHINNTSVVSHCFSSDNFHDRWGQLHSKPDILCGEGIPHTGLWHVGTREQIQQWFQWTSCEVCPTLFIGFKLCWPVAVLIGIPGRDFLKILKSKFWLKSSIWALWLAKYFT